jgi:hypothetical protein
MRKVRTFIVVAVVTVVACVGVFGAAQAGAEEWAGPTYHLNSGQTGYLNRKVWVYASDVLAVNSAIGCAGIVGVGSMACEEYAGSGAGVVYADEYWSEPYIHNHSGWPDNFRGFWY